MNKSGESIWDAKMATVKLDDLESKLKALESLEHLVATNKCSYELAIEQYKEVLEVQVKAHKVEK